MNQYLKFLIFAVLCVSSFSCSKVQYSNFGDTKMEMLSDEKAVKKEFVSIKALEAKKANTSNLEIENKITIESPKTKLVEQSKTYSKKQKRAKKLESKIQEKFAKVQKKITKKKNADFGSWWNSISPILKIAVIFIGVALFATIFIDTPFVLTAIWVIGLILLIWGLIDTYV